MKNKKFKFVAAGLAAVFALSSISVTAVFAEDSVSITNVSYDPTRELYEQYNKVFQKHWKEQTGQDVEITQSKVEQEVPITVFFEEGTTDKQIKAIGKKIQARPEVEKIEYESAEDAWESFKDQYFQGSEAAEGFKDDNPLVNSSNYRVYMNDITKQSELVEYVKSLKHVREVNQSQEAADTLGNINNHGDSGKQALEVANGLEADVVTLALEYDVKAIEDAGLIDEGWVDEFPDDSSPYTSTIVFLVRKGNPKDIKDWDDLVKNGVGVITPNPKTSGGARWNYLAAWAYADKQYDGDEDKIKDFIKKLYQNVLVLDSGARGATTSFVENGQGDVLIAWENEAYLSVQDYPDDYEIVTPSISILAQPSVAIVDKVVDDRGTREVATEYLNYLYSDEAQRIAGDNYYRPSNEEILKEYSDVFNLDINLVTIDDFGGWTQAQETHFADGGIFDQIYEQ